MIRAFKYVVIIVLVISAAAAAYGAKGYWDALADAGRLAGRADELIAQGRGGDALGAPYRAILLAVEDPGFANHSGIDVSTAGAGATTITQSASKRLAFDTFRPGIGKIRQTGYALGLEQKLSKEQILALWLDTLEMGQGPDGRMIGFFTASSKIFAKQPGQLSQSEFIRLVAVLIAPDRYDLVKGNAELSERVNRIMRLVSGLCKPQDHGDVWLEGCKT